MEENRQIVKACFRENFDTRFNERKAYSFFNRIEGIKVGDLVVVDTRYGLGLGKVTGFSTEKEIEENDGYAATHYVVGTTNIVEEVRPEAR